MVTRACNQWATSIVCQSSRLLHFAAFYYVFFKIFSTNNPTNIWALATLLSYANICNILICISPNSYNTPSPWKCVHTCIITMAYIIHCVDFPMSPQLYKFHWLLFRVYLYFPPASGVSNIAWVHCIYISVHLQWLYGSLLWPVS